MSSPISAADSTTSNDPVRQNVKIVSSAPIEHLNPDGTATGVTIAKPDTIYTLVKYLPVGLNGRPQVILTDSQGQQYRINLGATDYTAPPPPPETNSVPAPSVVIPSPTVTTNTPPQPPTPAVNSGTVAAVASNNIVSSPGAYSYHAPPGWKINASPTLITVCDMISAHDCAASISTCSIPNDDSLKKFAQDQRNFEKEMQAHNDCQIGDLQPFTTDSGWEGLMFVETVSSAGSSTKQLHYYFSGKDDTKIDFGTFCHGESVDHYTPLFDAAIKSLVRE